MSSAAGVSSEAGVHGRAIDLDIGILQLDSRLPKIQPRYAQAIVISRMLSLRIKWQIAYNYLCHGETIDLLFVTSPAPRTGEPVPRMAVTFISCKSKARFCCEAF